jgi:hypothetical protein
VHADVGGDGAQLVGDELPAGRLDGHAG